jgi:TonB family protein
MRFIAAGICLVFIAVLSAQETHRVEVTKQVEADYGNLTNGYLVDIVEVEMTVGPDGVPFALKTNASLPDNVVSALSQWRYKPVKTKTGGWFGVSLKTPVRRPIDARVEKSLRRTWVSRDKDIATDVAAGADLDAARATELERRIQEDSGDIAARDELLAYYSRTAGGEARTKQIAWMVEHHPESEILGGPFGVINPQDGLGYKQVKDLWLTALHKDPGNIGVVENASNFLRIADGEKAEQVVLATAPNLPKARVWIGDIWAMAALGVTALDTLTGAPVLAGTELPKEGYGARARGSLMSVADSRILLSALASVVEGGRALSRAGHLPAGYLAFCEDLRGRVLKIYPGTSYTCDATRAPAKLEDPEQIFTSDGPARVRQPDLIKKALPHYPPEAKRRGITGTCRFRATIGKDGKIRDLELVSSPLIFYADSRDTVSQWEYRPMLVNGKPVEVVTTIDTNYNLSR